ncbi:MAG: hypothetical protein AB1505_13945 [Candidatus Latescibacterota bacterium]
MACKWDAVLLDVEGHSAVPLRSIWKLPGGRLVVRVSTYREPGVYVSDFGSDERERPGESWARSPSGLPPSSRLRAQHSPRPARRPTP